MYCLGECPKIRCQSSVWLRYIFFNHLTIKFKKENKLSDSGMPQFYPGLIFAYARDMVLLIVSVLGFLSPVYNIKTDCYRTFFIRDIVMVYFLLFFLESFLTRGGVYPGSLGAFGWPEILECLDVPPFFLRWVLRWLGIVPQPNLA